MSVGSPDPRLVCKVCLDHEVEMVALPCGHVCLCEQCSESLVRSHAASRVSRLTDSLWNMRVARIQVWPPCPVCRGPVEEARRIFF